MPRIQDLPMPAQAQIAASRGEAPTAPAAEADPKRMNLLRRLATVGFGGKPAQDMPQGQAPQGQAPQGYVPQVPTAPAPQAYAPQAAYPTAPRMPAPPAPEARRPQAPQGYRPAQGNLDPQGRAVPSVRIMEDDQLEIPAFLRRQAN